MNDLRGKGVLVTGGTKGIGLATGIAFGKLGARVVVTYKWGSASEDEVRAAFEAQGAGVPLVCEADAANKEDTVKLLTRVAAELGPLEVFVSNVSMAALVRSVDDYAKRALFRSIEYTAWPMYEYTIEAKRITGRYPRYVVGLSSGGPDHYHLGYDFVAASKAVLECLCRYMAYRLRDDDVRVNVVRSHLVSTQSLHSTFGPEFEPFAHRFGMERQMIKPEEVAGAIVGLASGWMDGVSGHVLMVDRGATFADNLMRIYGEREELGL